MNNYNSLELQKKEMHDGIERIMDYLRSARTCLLAGRSRIALLKKGISFLLNYSPDEIMRINLWERNSHQVEKEIRETEAILRSYQDNFSFYRRGMTQWLASLQDKLVEINHLLNRE